ncbi:hypothetical protein F5B18DRAFT_651565 [Nemania serpens]|nr:hypothetical protein F5B18DRAFT_651565 [Nemania serpens]
MSRKEGSALSDVRKRDALNEVLMHNDWFLRHLLVDDQSIIVVPRYKVDYRDEYLPAPEFRSLEGFDSNFHASLSGSANARFTLRFQAKKSISQSLYLFLLQKRRIIGLLSLVHDYLVANKLPTTVLTGRTAFEIV